MATPHDGPKTPALNAELHDVIRDVVRYEFDDRMTFRRNGHTWREFLVRKIVTPDRVLWLMLASVGVAYMIGGEVRDYQVWRARVDALVAQEAALADQQRAVSAQQRAVSERQRTVSEQQRLFEEQYGGLAVQVETLRRAQDAMLVSQEAMRRQVSAIDQRTRKLVEEE